MLGRTDRFGSGDGALVLTTLPADSVPLTVRGMLEQRLGRWSLDRLKHEELIYNLHVCASELVTNACRATPHTAITFRAVRVRASITVSVWDASDLVPSVAGVTELDVTPDARALDDGYDDGTGGLGLPLVLALSSELGVQRTAPRGKWIWARFDLG